MVIKFNLRLDKLKIHFCVYRIEFSALAVAHKAVNVGQGFIDYEPPRYLIDFYKETLDDPNILLHQYTRGFVGFHSIISKLFK